VILKTRQLALEKRLEDNQKHIKAVARNAYGNQKERVIDDDQITQYLPLVHKVVNRVVSYIKPPLSYDDLVSAGTIGLIKAAKDYDSSHQAEFKTYAYIRIRGAVLDEFRSFSFLPANVDKQIRQAAQVSMEIAEEKGKTPTHEELAEKLEVSVDKLHQTFNNARVKHFVSLDSSTENSSSLGLSLEAVNTDTPDRKIEQKELIEKLTEAIQQLNERQRNIILLYYQKEMTMKQIAEVFDITEPRVSQLHASALFNLSVKLRPWNDGR
jgi:RNA polymerase sigma factor for flagellar operon FliA